MRKKTNILDFASMKDQYILSFQILNWKKNGKNFVFSTKNVARMSINSSINR